MNLVVVEDNLKFNERISITINNILKEEKIESKIVRFYEYNKELEKIIHNKEVKIYILDIEIKGYSGYDIAREIRESANDWESIIIIASVHNLKEKIISLRLSILTYLLKFDNFDKNLKDTIKTAINIFKQKGFIDLTDNYKLLSNDILYIMKEKNSKYCIIKTTAKEIRIRNSLKKLQEELHLTKYKKHILVNEHYIKEKNNKYIVFKDNTKLYF